MNFFDYIILPHSGDNLDLIRNLLILATVIYWIYGGLFFGSAFLSVFFNIASRKTKNIEYSGLSLDYAEFLTGNKVITIGLGVIPFMSIIFFFAEVLKSSGSDTPLYLLFSFTLFLIGVYLIYSYKNALKTRIVLDSIDNQGIVQPNEDLSDLPAMRNSYEKQTLRSGFWGIVFLFLSFWIYVSAYDLSVRLDDWSIHESIITTLFSIGTIIKFLHFLCSSFSIIFAAFLLGYYFTKDKIIKSDDGFIHKFNTYGLLTLSAVQPLLFVLNLYVTPRQAVSTIVFTIILIALVLVFILLHLEYNMIKEKKYGNIKAAFYLLLAVFALVILKEQVAFGVASEKHVYVLAEDYKKIEKEELTKAGLLTVKISGEDIYQTKCTACHKFDVRLVGPPHKLVMLKYKNDQQAMINFILNPHKVDPNYPAMPSQGLKPDEAKAVVDYMFQHFGNELQ
jgi:cytochrome c551/c552